jgi:proteasome lid subunit RPN8/RPN11
MVLKIKKKDLDLIFHHSKKCYPLEACGILVGKRFYGEKIVEKVYITKNILMSPHAYQIDPKDQVKIFKEAEKENLEVLGFFHSHPLHEPFWSKADDEQSRYWIGYSYLIVSLKSNSFRCYFRNRESIEEEEVVII